MAGALNIFTKVWKEKLEIQTTAQMATDITAIVRKIYYDLSLKSHELIKSSLKSTTLLQRKYKTNFYSLVIVLCQSLYLIQSSGE